MIHGMDIEQSLPCLKNKKIKIGEIENSFNKELNLNYKNKF